MSTLSIWINGRHVGDWRQVRAERDEFRYDPAWLKAPQFRALSLSIPVTATATVTGRQVRNYFDNLLPDDPRIRERLQRRFDTRSAGPFDLLAALGRDCVGAVQVLPADETPTDWNRITAERLSSHDVAMILAAVPTATAPALAGADDEEDFRISIAGGQEKTALLRMGKVWYRPRGATPTTHILKLPLGTAGGLKLDLSHSVDNEWLCAALLTEMGLPVAPCEIGRFEQQRVLVVERFDRGWQGLAGANPRATRFKPPPRAWIARVPQEDFCQIVGVSHDQKYESHGGPGIPEILQILSRARDPMTDRRTFVLAQLAFWMLAAIDGHAKNFSIFHYRGGSFGLTPLYDVLSAWPVIGRGANNLALRKVKLAMALRGSGRAHYKLTEIQPRHFEALALCLGDPDAWPAMQRLAAEVPGAIARVQAKLPEDLSQTVWQHITNGLRRQATSFLAAASRSGS